MDLLLVLLVAAAFPMACLAFVLWMGRIEDSLPEAVRRSTREPDPLPVLAIPVRRPAPTVVIPEQRTASPAVPAVVPEAVAAAPQPISPEPTGT